MQTTGKMEQMMVVGKTITTNEDAAQAMLNRMAMIQIEAAIQQRVMMETAKDMAASSPARSAVGVTLYQARHSASHYVLCLCDPRWRWNVRPNVAMLYEIGKGWAAETVAAMHMEAMQTRAAAEEKAATHPTLQ